MKKILLVVAVAGLTLASCKKDRTCSCTSTVSSSGGTVSYSSSSNQDVTIVKESKKIAKLACVHTKSSSTSNNVTTTIEYDCKLK